MKITANRIEDKVDEFLNVLTRDVRRLQMTLSWLDEMRGFVIKHDDVALQKLLETIQSQAGSFNDNELKREFLRKELAILLDRDPGKITLSALELELFGEKKAQVTRMKAQLQALVEELKQEHLKTTMLLSDCSRFNRLLLENVFELGSTREITYSPSGFAERNSETGFVNMQF